MSGGGDATIASYNGALQVINAGPLPVEVEAVSSSSAGLRVNRSADARRTVTVPSGAARQIYVGIGLGCRDWDPEQPIELSVDVITADGNRRRRTSPVSIQDTPWFELLMATCQPDF